MESTLRNSQPFDLLNRLCELPGLDLQPYFALAPVPCKFRRGFDSATMGYCP